MVSAHGAVVDRFRLSCLSSTQIMWYGRTVFGEVPKNDGDWRDRWGEVRASSWTNAWCPMLILVVVHILAVDRNAT